MTQDEALAYIDAADTLRQATLKEQKDNYTLDEIIDIYRHEDEAERYLVKIAAQMDADEDAERLRRIEDDLQL